MLEIIATVDLTQLLLIAASRVMKSASDLSLLQPALAVSEIERRMGKATTNRVNIRQLISRKTTRADAAERFRTPPTGESSGSSRVAVTRVASRLLRKVRKFNYRIETLNRGA